MSNTDSSAPIDPTKETTVTAGERSIIQLRATKNQVARIDAAADFLGLTRSAFIRQSALADAVRVLSRHEPPPFPATPETPHE